MSYDITGKLIVIGDVQTFSSGFTKRTFVIETTADRYPQTIPLEVVKDKCALLDGFAVGDMVTASYDLRGSYHAPSDRYFVNVQAWRIDRDGQQRDQPTAQEARQEVDALRDQDDDDTSGMPF